MDFKETLKKRRSIYSLSKNSPISDKEIVELIEFAVEFTPSAYDCQSQKLVVLLKEKHDHFWDIVLETLRPFVPAENFGSTEKKIASFKNSYGTILYFDDESITKKLQVDFSLYADKFPVYAQQSNGMLQINIWNMLEANGLGASLQHYNPLIDEAVKKAFDIPMHYQLVAQMPFGTPTAYPDPKKEQDTKSRITILQ